MIVYIATNKMNGKQYIGYTTLLLDNRIKNHIRKAFYKAGKHYNYFFQRALRKYSNDAFIWEILYTCKNKSECCTKEIEYIKKYNSIAPNGYNLTHGGEGGIQSDITKLKISNSIKKIHADHPEKYDRMQIMTKDERSTVAKKAWKTKKINGYKTTAGYTHTEDSKQKMSITKNNKNTIQWKNIFTSEIVYKSLTDMSKYTGLTIGTFSHVKQLRTKQTNCGWTIIL